MKLCVVCGKPDLDEYCQQCLLLEKFDIDEWSRHAGISDRERDEDSESIHARD